MDINNNFKILFSTENNNIKYEVANIREDGTFTILFREIASEDKEYVERVLQAHGFVAVPDVISTEIASHGGLEYSNHPDVIEMAFEDDDEDIEDAEGDAPSEVDPEDGLSEGEVASVEYNVLLKKLEEKGVPVSVRQWIAISGKSPAEIARSLDGVSDETRLKVIGNPEMMKFANKVYDMVSPGEDKSTYAAFLYDFDDFLMMYRPNNDYSAGGEEEESEEPSSVAESASDDKGTIKVEHRGASLYSTPGWKASEVAGFINLFGDIHTASAFLTDFKDYLPAEIAKGKNARSALLSALMKGMSGEAGLAAVAAWEAGDSEKLQSALSTVVGQVVSKIEKTKE